MKHETWNMKHETFTSSGNAKSELEDYSRKIAAKPSLVGTIHRNDGGLVGNFAMLNQHDVVAGNAHFLSWAEQSREEKREKERYQMTLIPPPSLGATYEYIPHRPPRSRAELYCCGGEL